MTDKTALLRGVNANPRDRLRQLVLADYLADHGDSRGESYWRCERLFGGRPIGLDGIGGLVGHGGFHSGGLDGIGSLGEFGGLGGLGGIGGIVGFGGLGGLDGIGGGLGGRGGLGGYYSGGLDGIGGLGGRVGLISPENPIVLIPGEDVLAFMPHGYGCTVFIGHVKTETPVGWIVEPARTVEQINPRNAGDARWVELAAGDDKSLRRMCRYGPWIKGGVRLPLGVFSLLWHKGLPK